MTSTPLVSIICLCYNHENFVKESLDSVVNQSYKNIQIIIVDDYSSDNSVSEIENWIKNHSDVTFIKNSKNMGNNLSFNQVLPLVKGDYVIDFATDDVLFEDTIASQIEAFHQNPSAALVFGNAELVDEKGKHLSYHFHTNSAQKVLDTSLHKTNYISLLKGGNCMCSVSAMMKKSVVDTLKGYDESLFYEDLDFWFRLSKQYSITFIDQPLVQKRVINTSQSTFFYKKNEYAKKINASTYKILRKAYVMNTSVEEHQALLKRVHFEMVHNLKLKNYGLLFKNALLKVKIHARLVFRSF